MASHPKCGLYKTTRALDTVPEGQLVYFHDHGNPGPGIYLPKSWRVNRAEFSDQGIPVPGPEWSASLAALAPEGFYSVEAAFHCCEKRCMRYEPGQLVQLGYDGRATAILFLPEWTPSGLAIPERGNRIDSDRMESLRRLTVATTGAAAGEVTH